MEDLHDLKGPTNLRGFVYGPKYESTTHSVWGVREKSSA